MNSKKKLLSVVAIVSIMIVSFVTSAFGEDPNPNCNDRDVRPGRTIVVPAKCRVHGDVYVGKPGTVVNEENARLKPDEDGETGMIVDCVTQCKVFFKFGGGITGQLVDSISVDMAKTGCGNGCAHGAHVVVWPFTARAEDSTPEG